MSQTGDGSLRQEGCQQVLGLAFPAASSSVDRGEVPCRRRLLWDGGGPRRRVGPQVRVGGGGKDEELKDRSGTGSPQTSELVPGF